MLGTVAAVVLGAAFVAAGVFKLADGPAWPKQAADMGVVRPVAVVVPWVEIVIGVALAAQFFEPWPALAAIVFLVGATVVIVRRLLDGSRPPCACFGSRSTRPLGAYHVARNGGLLVLAMIAAAWA